MSPGCGKVSRQRAGAPWCFPAAGKVMRFPHGELQRAGDEDDHANHNRYGARQHRLLHLERRQRHANRISDHSEQHPDEEVTQAHERGQLTEARLPCSADGLAKAP
jgi:hypothetical protein